MIPFAVVAAVGAVIGGVIAIAARDGRLVALGLVLAMVATPLVAAPEPPALTVAFRILGASLAGYLLWVAVRAESISGEGSGIGPVAEIAAAAAAFCVGWLVAPVKPLAGPVEAQAAGISLVVLAVAPLIGRNVLRVGAGFAILTLGLSLLLEAWIGPASSLQEIVVTALLIGTVGATGLLISPMEPAPLAEDATATEGLAGSAETGQAAVEPAEEPIEGVEPGPADKPAAAPEPTPEATPETAPEAAPRRVATVRAAGPRSPRAIRHSAPARPAKSPAPIDEAAPVEAAPVEGPPPMGDGASVDEPAPTRTRRLRPREPRP